MLRFRATIELEGINPYVDVPARVSKALAAHADRGKIRVEGTLGGESFRGTLVPKKGGIHRYYVYGALRTRAKVDVGDTVSVALRACADDESPPDELSRALAKARATEAFDALPVTRRRELARYVDAAATDKLRAERVAETVAHVLGKELAKPRTPRGAKERPLWRCPKCGNLYTGKNHPHSCVRVTLDQLFDAVGARIEKLGPCELSISKTRVAILVKVRFASVTPRKDAIDLAIWLTRRVDDPRFRRIETLSPRVHIHTMRIERESELDARDVGTWLRESYAIGRREHLAD
jgi:hypothetical protein